MTRLAAVARYHAVLGRARRLAGTRALRDGPTAGELLLEDQWERDMRPALTAMYSRPITAGLETMMGQSRAAITRWVLAYYREREDILAPARATLGDYARRGFNLGGQMGLDELDLDGQFELTDETILEQVDAHVAGLVSAAPAAPLSVAVTTAKEIGREVERRQEEGVELVDLLPLLSAWVLGRTVIRSAMIAATESVRMTRWGMAAAFVGNGIGGVRHECEADVEQRCTSGACPPLCGTEYGLPGVFNPMGGIPGAERIPLHPRCRCYYSPIQDGWVKPVLIWTGFAVGSGD